MANQWDQLANQTGAAAKSLGELEQLRQNSTLYCHLCIQKPRYYPQNKCTDNLWFKDDLTAQAVISKSSATWGITYTLAPVDGGARLIGSSSVASICWILTVCSGRMSRGAVVADTNARSARECTMGFGNFANAWTAIASAQMAW
jgi:hypothetical protein